MCTLIILRRPGHNWPLLVAANRDELRLRPALAPARHWPDRPEVVAGLDLEADGTWLGVNDHGVVAGVLNRTGTLGPAAGKRSRGELVLEALDHAEAGDAAGALADLNPDAYRPFNLIVADPRAAYWLRHDGSDDEIQVHPLPDGLHMIAATELDDPGHPRIARFLPQFREAAVPSPDRGDWTAWTRLLGNRELLPGQDAADAMNIGRIVTADGEFATVSSSLIAVPAYPGFDAAPRFLHADGPPDSAPYAEAAV